MNIYKIALFALVPLLFGGLAGTAVAAKPAKVEERSVQGGSARTVQVELAMQPGNLTIRGGANHLLDARFDYRPPAWKPRLSYTVSGTCGHLVVRQPRLQSVKSGRNTWDVRLTDRMPMDLNLASGPGNATLTLRSLTLKTLTTATGPGNVSIDAASPSLKTLKVSAGPGNLSVNLVAPWRHGVTATISGGIGNTTLQLPERVGVRVTVQGMARVDAADFTKQGTAYSNSAFGHSKVTVRVSLIAGLGNVVLTTAR
jgi:hypothetical protein